MHSDDGTPSHDMRLVTFNTRPGRATVPRRGDGMCYICDSCKELCDADSHVALNIVCCPVVLIWNAFYKFCCQCCWVCTHRGFDTFCCAPWRACGCCKQFTDERFPPGWPSINPDPKTRAATEAKISWMRAEDLYKPSVSKDSKLPRTKSVVGRMRLFQEPIEPKDVAQGGVGDCWLIVSRQP